jgi:hypothetical protein
VGHFLFTSFSWVEGLTAVANEHRSNPNSKATTLYGVRAGSELFPASCGKRPAGFDWSHHPNPNYEKNSLRENHLPSQVFCECDKAIEQNPHGLRKALFTKKVGAVEGPAKD